MSEGTSRQVEYHLRAPANDGSFREVHFNVRAQAMAVAATVAVHHGECVVDVVVLSEEGAHHFGGDSAVELYKQNPEAPVFRQIVITCCEPRTIQ